MIEILACGDKLEGQGFDGEGRRNFRVIRDKFEGALKKSKIYE